MSATWNMLERVLREAADPVDRLLRHVERRFSQHAAEELSDWIGANPSGDIRKYVAAMFVDDTADKLAAAVAKERGPATPKAASKRPSKDAPEPGASTDKGSFGEPIPQRPDRAGGADVAQMPVSKNLDPKSREFQAVGTAGQNQAQPQPSQAIVPKTKDTKELERLNALAQDEDWIAGKVARYMKSNPSAKPGEVRQALMNQLRTKISALGKHGVSTIKTAQGMDPNRFYKQGGSKTDADALPAADVDAIARGEKPKDAAPASTPHRPDFDGTFIGQRWSPNAFSRPDKPEDPDAPKQGEKGFDPELDARRAGGFGKRGTQHGDAATGQMAKGAVAQNPAKPGSVVTGAGPTKQRWSDTHDVIWAGRENGGWVTLSQFAALVAQGKIRRKASPGPSKPDLSQARSVSPVNPPKRD